MGKITNLKITINDHLTQVANGKEVGIEPIAQLSQTEKDVVNAMEKGKKISKMTANEIVILAGNIMLDAKIRLGHTTFTNEKETQIMISMDLRKNFSGLTDREVINGVTSGLNGDFAQENDKIIFSPANIIKWVKKYIEIIKAPAVKRYYALKEVPKPVPSSIEQLSLFNKSFLFVVTKIKSNLNEDGYLFNDFGNAFYNRLVELKIISLSIERKNQIFKEEKARLSSFPDADISSACKDRVLEEYILGWINSDTDLEKLLNDAILNYLKDS